jgi:heme oxygenase
MRILQSAANAATEYPETSRRLTAPGAAADLLTTLRLATRELHHRLEAQLQPTTEWTLERYAAMLQAFHQVIAPVESHLCERLGDIFVPPPPLSRTERLRSDLRALGQKVLPPARETRLAVQSPAEAHGVGYVLQGSLLGGAAIARQVRACCAHTAEPFAYLNLYGAGLSAAWKEFCQALNVFGRDLSDADRHRATTAAAETFRAVGAAFARVS